MSDQEEQSTRDNLPWTGKRTWEQKTEQTDTNDATGEPEVKDPSEDKQLPQVNEMQEAQQAAGEETQEVTPEEPVVEETRTEETTEVKYHQPEQGQDDSSSEDSDES